MKTFYTFLIFFSFSHALAKIPLLEKVKVSPTATPSFIYPMLTHMASFPPKDKNFDDIKVVLEKINENLQSIPSNHIKSFFMTQLFKSFFEPKNYSELQSISTLISPSVLKSFEEKTKKNKLLLSEFTQFFLLEILLSYEPYVKNNFINRYTNTSLTPKELEQKKKIMLLNAHQGPWISKFLQVQPDEFSHYLSNYIMQYLEDLAEFSILLKLNTKQEELKATLFMIPEKTEEKPEEEASKDDQTPAQAAEEKEDATDPKADVEKLDVEPTTGASEKIDKIIENMDKKTPQ